MANLGAVGERALVRRLLEIFGEGGSTVLGDDAAALRVGDRYLLLTTDVINERTHLPPAARGDQIGWYTAAVNLSDIAAMGGDPFALLVSFSVPRQLEATRLEAMAKGFRACASAHGAEVVGGDMKEGPEISVCGTAAGWTRGTRVLRRGGAQSGDLVAVTGSLGRAAWGLSRLGENPKDEEALEAVMHPTPRIEEGLILAENEGVTACMDISDGLAVSLSQMSEAGDVSYEIVYENLPADPRLLERNEAHQRESLLFHGGDFELLFTCRPGHWAHLADEFAKKKAQATPIGQVRASGENRLRLAGKVEVLEARGYEHFT
ncbi:MAG: thiamine-phosphate kinase [Thermoplasmata archaeon]